MPTSSRPSRAEAAAADKALRLAIAEDRAGLSPGKPGRRQHAGSPYQGYLSWSHLARLICDELRPQETIRWTPVEIEEGLRGRAGLPWKAQDRQILLEAIQRVLNASLDIAISPPLNRPAFRLHQYVNRQFLGTEPVARSLDVLNFKPSSIGFFRLSDWSQRRLLLEEHVVNRRVSQRAGQDWFPADVLDSFVAEERERRKGSQCPTLVGYERDDREAQGQDLVLKIADSSYYQHVAARRCIRANPEVYERLVREVRKGGAGADLNHIIEHSPPSNIAINVTVMSRSGSLLLIKRPEESTTWGNRYQVGPHETMNWAVNGEKDENCFDLARRALREEVGIDDPALYDNRIVFSWFGYYLPEASGYFFAHIRTRMTEDQIVESIANSSSNWEAGEVQWMDLTQKSVRDVIGTWRGQPWPTDTADESDRLWLPHAVMSLTQLYRILGQGMLPTLTPFG